MPRDFITRTELGALIGVTSTNSFQKWERAGLPKTKKQSSHGGRAACLYDRRAALEWLRDHGSLKISQRARQVLEEGGGGKRAGPKGKPKPAPAADAGGGEDGEAASVGAGDWVDGTLAPIARRWVRVLNTALDNGDTVKALNATKALAVISETKRKEEEAERQKRIEEGELVNAADLTERHSKILNTLKNNILGVADSIMPAVMPYLRDANDAPAIKKITSDKLKDALRSTANTRNFD